MRFLPPFQSADSVVNEIIHSIACYLPAAVESKDCFIEEEEGYEYWTAATLPRNPCFILSLG